ncbi:MAG: hypothetical protein AAF974_01030 [Cyanobacteria bacterium P01_E01_bin.34]
MRLSLIRVRGGDRCPIPLTTVGRSPPAREEKTLNGTFGIQIPI